MVCIRGTSELEITVSHHDQQDLVEQIQFARANLPQICNAEEECSYF